MRRSIDEERRVFVDTSAFAAVALSRDTHHREALRISTMLRQGNRQLLTSNFVAAETHALVLRRAGRNAAWRMLQLVDSSTEVVRVIESDEERGRAILDRYTDKDFSLTDATSFAVMDRLGIRLAFAFDEHFAQYGLTVLEAE